MRNIRRNHDHVARPKDHFLITDLELQDALEDIFELFTFMTMHLDHAALRHEYLRNRYLFTGDDFARELLGKNFFGYGVPGKDLHAISTVERRAMAQSKMLRSPASSTASESIIWR